MADEHREMLCRDYGYAESFARIMFPGTTPEEVDAGHATWLLYKASKAAGHTTEGTS